MELMISKQKLIFPDRIQTLLLVSGIISSIWYITINVIVPIQYTGYDVVNQTVSELSAIDAPTRPLWMFLCFFYSVFVLAFGLGILISASKIHKLKIPGILFIIYGVSGFFWPPMHQREVLAAGGGTISDTLHIAFSFFTVLMMMVMIILSAFALDKKFRIISFLILSLLIIFGILTSLDAPNISKNLPTAMIGIWERINIGMFMIWTALFSLKLLQLKKQDQ